MFKNLVKIFASEIVEGNWSREQVPEQLEKDVEKEIENILETKDQEEEVKELNQ